MKILLADDSEESRLLIQMTLQHGNHIVDSAENGVLAVERFKESTYDLILLDMQMPVLDGFSAAHLIRKWETDKALKPTPIIALTGSLSREDKEKARNAGCNHYLTKPVIWEQLFEVIQLATLPLPVLADEITELIPVFLENRKRDVSCLEEAIARDDILTIEAIGHKIKGNSGGYGFHEMGRIGSSIEDAAKAKNMDQLRSKILELRKQVEAAQSAMRKNTA